MAGKIRFLGLTLLLSLVDPVNELSLAPSAQQTDFTCIYAGVNISYFQIFGHS